ncbi:MAG: hypothetical protein ACI392_05880 [Paludibacteraceae bacterium]
MEFEDIIYVLVALVAVGAGILKRINNSFAKATKQRPAQPKPMEEPTFTADDSPSRDWEKPLQQMTTESFPEVQFVYTDSMETTTSDNPNQTIDNQTTTSEAVRPNVPVATAPLVSEQPQPIIDFTDMDEVKKAVIASEILQRKY